MLPLVYIILMPLETHLGDGLLCSEQQQSACLMHADVQMRDPGMQESHRTDYSWMISGESFLLSPELISALAVIASGKRVPP